MAHRVFPFDQLREADLVVDAVYKGGEEKNMRSEVLSKLIPGLRNQGGFRAIGPSANPRLIVLYSTLEDINWPDSLDELTGLFIYFGDNRTPGRDLHDTSKKGNSMLREMYTSLHVGDRTNIPPVLIFTNREEADSGYDRVFRGLAVPGASELTESNDLVAMWKTQGGERFQNYKAAFTVLNIGRMSKTWLQSIIAGDKMSKECPEVYKSWIRNGVYQPLKAEPVKRVRTKAEQLPKTTHDQKMIDAIYQHFKDEWEGFEECAAQLIKLMDVNIDDDVEVTRRYKDGGIDAYGYYWIGKKTNRLRVDFALQAKCYSLDNSVTVKDTSRLISRLRNRQFGIMVTTSYVAPQAYNEIIEDEHPVLIISASDIVDILKTHGYSDAKLVKGLLNRSFPAG